MNDEFGGEFALIKGRLNARQVATVSKPGFYSDGGNLYLRVAGLTGRSWIFRYERNGRQHDMGLGPLDVVSLAEARELALAAGRQLHEKKDPIEEKSIKPSAVAKTFGEVADAYLKSMSPQWTNPKHIAQWQMSLEKLAADLRPVSVDKVDTDKILTVLKPLWETTPETASRLRGRIENVLDSAKASGYRSGENPARWRGHLDQLLPKRNVLSRGHHKAVGIDAVPDVYKLLVGAEGISAMALRFTILTAARTGEVIGALWREVDFKEKTWTVPIERMKARKPHRVPLANLLQLSSCRFLWLDWAISTIWPVRCLGCSSAALSAKDNMRSY